MRRKIIHSAENIYHLYLKTLDGRLLFYTRSDYLVFYTIFSTTASTTNLQILGLCLMFDHIHILVRCPGDFSELKRFVRLFTSRYTTHYNTVAGITGRLFNSPIGIAPKCGNKLVRTAIAYLYNNPVERKLCRRAEDFRWNFLAYASSHDPFSINNNSRQTSIHLKKAFRLIDWFNSRQTPLTHNFLQNLSLKLSQKEMECITDYIIATYSPINYKELVSYYGSYDNMLLAINSNTGSEYDIREDFVAISDKPYIHMAKIAASTGSCSTPNKVLRLTTDEKIDLVKVFLWKASASVRQIGKFLGIKITHNTGFLSHFDCETDVTGNQSLTF